MFGLIGLLTDSFAPLTYSCILSVIYFSKIENTQTKVKKKKKNTR